MNEWINSDVLVCGDVIDRPSAGITSAISKFSAAAQLGSAPGAGSGALTISNNERRRILEEEQRQLDILKVLF